MNNTLLKPLMIMLMVVFAMASCTKQDYEISEQEDLDDVAEMLMMASSDGQHHSNGCQNFTCIDPDSLPSVIINYIDSNYPGNTKQNAMIDGSSNYYVKIKDSTSTKFLLKFDSTGNFLYQQLLPPPGSYSNVDSIDLLSNTVAFIDSTYPGWTFKKGLQKPDSSYVVIIKEATGNYVGLLFDPAGNFVDTVCLKGIKGRKKGKHKGKRKGKGKGKRKGR